MISQINMMHLQFILAFSST